MNDTWVMFADAHTPTVALLKAREQLEQEPLSMSSNQRYYRITVEDITTEPEKPQWWRWTDGQGWEAKGDNGEPTVTFPYGRLSITLHGTTQDREDKLLTVKDAIHKADMP